MVSLSLTNSTVSGNTADFGGGIFAYDDSTVNLANAFIAGNTASIRPDCRGVLTSLGHNLIGDTTGCSFTPSTGDLVNVGPMLGPPEDNGGATFTHALLAGSPAIDSGNPAALGTGGAACPQTDQRGVERPADGDGDDIAICDIGAFELVPGANFPHVAFDQPVSTSGLSPMIIELSASDVETGDTLTFIIVSLPSSGELFEGITGDKITTGGQVLGSDTVTYIAQVGFVGNDSFTFKVNDGETDSNIATVTVTVTEVTIQGTVALQGLSNPLTGAIVTFSSGDLVAQVTTDPEGGSFQVQLPTGTYNVTVGKDGFLRAHVEGLLVNRDLVLTEVKLLWGDANGDGVDVTDLTVTGRNLGLDVSPWDLPPTPVTPETLTQQHLMICAEHGILDRQACADYINENVLGIL